MDGGNVITVEGDLTLNDSVGSGVITGGCNDGQGGGIRVTGSFTMNGGSIRGNTAYDARLLCGGGVAVLEGGSLTMNGGAITGNTANGAASNLFLPGEALKADTRIGVSLKTAPAPASPIAFTDGFDGQSAACFLSDRAGYSVGVRNGESCLVCLPAFKPDFVLPAGLSRVEAEAFEDAVMTSVSVPEGCVSIGDRAFSGCAALG